MKINKQECESLKLLEKQEAELLKAIEDNESLVKTVLAKESPSEMKIKLEIESLTKKLGKINCSFEKVTLSNQIHNKRA